jgi:hypothetical protein
MEINDPKHASIVLDGAVQTRCVTVVGQPNIAVAADQFLLAVMDLKAAAGMIACANDEPETHVTWFVLVLAIHYPSPRAVLQQ